MCGTMFIGASANSLEFVNDAARRSAGRTLADFCRLFRTDRAFAAELLDRFREELWFDELHVLFRKGPWEVLNVIGAECIHEGA